MYGSIPLGGASALPHDHALSFGATPGQSRYLFRPILSHRMHKAAIEALYAIIGFCMVCVGKKKGTERKT
jgi:hypothetical protein